VSPWSSPGPGFCEGPERVHSSVCIHVAPWAGRCSEVDCKCVAIPWAVFDLDANLLTGAPHQSGLLVAPLSSWLHLTLPNAGLACTCCLQLFQWGRTIESLVTCQGNEAAAALTSPLCGPTVPLAVGPSTGVWWPSSRLSARPPVSDSVKCCNMRA
jgi:hypothetical protein